MKLFFMACIAVSLTACALTDGEPWGQAEMQVALSFAPAADRLTVEGHLKTTNDYAVQIDQIALSVESVSLRISAVGGGAVDFDPANPPAGYGLCHNGHCHSDDGRLLSYEEIAAETGDAVDAGTVVVQPITAEAHLLQETAVQTVSGECPDRCALPRGTATRLSVMVHRLHVSGVVFDTLDPPRIPAEGIAFSGVIDVERSLDAILDATIDRGEPVGLGLLAEVPVTSRLFDGIDWSLVPVTQGVAEPVVLVDHPDIVAAIVQNLSEHTEIEVRMERN